MAVNVLTEQNVLNSKRIFLFLYPPGGFTDVKTGSLLQPPWGTRIFRHYPEHLLAEVTHLAVLVPWPIVNQYAREYKKCAATCFQSPRAVHKHLTGC